MNSVYHCKYWDKSDLGFKGSVVKLWTAINQKVWGPYCFIEEISQGQNSFFL